MSSPTLAIAAIQPADCMTMRQWRSRALPIKNATAIPAACYSAVAIMVGRKGNTSCIVRHLGPWASSWIIAINTGTQEAHSYALTVYELGACTFLLHYGRFLP